ncbi:MULTISPECIES: hypothetical protein [unclassified Imperialibacter]|uniref:hypothetical protein n=1 Tax=unclassified Imperialibacter TaxID=2629706 RepID=UPI00125F00BC|nr:MULTISPECIES: hypothetical protein [unclassified Imperialibacter]
MDFDQNGYTANWISSIKKNELKAIDKLELDSLWGSEDNFIWKASQVVGLPSFYPIYQYRDFFTTNPLPLILMKGHLLVNKRFLAKYSPDGRYYSGSDTIDKEIVRVGAPMSPGFVIQSKEVFIARICEAITEDIKKIESLHPSHNHVLLCGGKDSLNMLLFPWSKPVVVASAPPNYELVRNFIEENKITCVKEMICLSDTSSRFEDMEILANVCRNSLEHCRWINDLQLLAERYPRSVFWKGQLGDTFLTPSWKKYRHQKVNFLDKLKPDHWKQKDFFNSLWLRGAMWQGAHMSQLRLLTGKLFLSFYHGANMTSLLQQVDLSSCVMADIRTEIGNFASGKEVVYPELNPSPGILKRTEGISSPERFLSLIESFVTIDQIVD